MLLKGEIEMKTLIFVICLVLLASASFAERFYDFSAFYLGLTSKANFNTDGRTPLRAAGFSVGVGVKQRIHSDTSFVVTPGASLRFIVGGWRERLRHEWAYAHTNIGQFMIQPSLAIGKRTENGTETGIEFTWYDITVGQGYERYSNLDITRTFQAKGIGIAFYSRTNTSYGIIENPDSFFTFTPYAPLSCGKYGKAYLSSMSWTINY